MTKNAPTTLPDIQNNHDTRGIELEQVGISDLRYPITVLDRENERLVLEALERLSAGCTTLHITHRLAAARRADRILFVADGRILEDGTHAALLAHGGHYARLWQGLGEPPACEPSITA